MAVNGAEPVRDGTLDRFTRAFALCVFDPAAHTPCYDLAEATLFVSGTRPDAAEPGDSVYHDVAQLRVPLALDRDRLRSALRALARRHEALRTAFEVDAAPQPIQWVKREVPIALEGSEEDDLAPRANEALAARWFERERWRPFDLARPPLLRFAAHRAGTSINDNYFCRLTTTRTAGLA